MNNDKLRTIITYLFTFFLAFFLFMIALLSCVRFTIMSPSFFSNSMESVDYYNNTATEVTRAVKQLARGAGFEPDYFAKIVKEEDIRDNMVAYQTSMLQGEQAVVDTATFKENLNTAITKYAQDKNITIDRNVQSALDTFILNCTEKFTHLTQFPYLDVVGNTMRMYQKIYVIATPVLLVVSIGVGFFIFKLQASRHRRKKYFGVVLLGTGLLTATGPAVVYAMRMFEKITLNPEYVYDLLVHFSKSFLLSCIIIGVVLMILGICVAYIKFKGKSRTKNDRVYRTHQLQREE